MHNNTYVSIIPDPAGLDYCRHFRINAAWDLKPLSLETNRCNDLQVKLYFLTKKRELKDFLHCVYLKLENVNVIL
jgi:hypothetical protein